MADAVYIHIPFCQHICNYCDFPKILANEEIIDNYLVALKEEVITRYQNETINTIYIGGGTPSLLSTKQLNYLYEITSLFKTSSNLEFSIESNVDEMTNDKIIEHQKHGINRISIGIETFNKDHLKYLGRIQTLNSDNLVKRCQALRLNNVNIDMMYAFKNQTLEELNQDLDKLIKLNPQHISYYSLIIEEHTKLFINKEKNIDEDLEYQMYQLIINKLKKAGYIHYEISNFKKRGYESKHNLKYWNNQEYYGFGLGACSYLNNKRRYNTKDINTYINKEYLKEEYYEDKLLRLENYLMLGFRKIAGIKINQFNELFQEDILNNHKVNKMLNDKLLVIKDGYLKISYDKIYVSNYILRELIGEFNE